ncbi:MAG: helix-turn-helix transcriptional regulator [Phycisphaeraceae bacterium]|nr:helix-turn-helix transcriptional regulator [Phycisphaeraceae bacterium]
MADLTQALKEEISKLARKELGVDLKKTLQELKGLREQLVKLDGVLSKLEVGVAAPAQSRANPVRDLPARLTVGRGPTSTTEFSPKKLQSHRRKLGLSAADYALLCGLSQLSIYHYEQGKTRPRAGSLAAIEAVQKMSQQQILQRLAALKGT